MNRLGTVTQRMYLTRNPTCVTMVEADNSDGLPIKSRTQIVRENLLAKEQHNRMARTKALEQWRDGVRFNDETGTMTAHVDPSNGKLVLRGEGGNLEFWETPQAWLKEVVKVEPEKNIDALVAQLAEALGAATWIDHQAVATKPLNPKPAIATPASAATPAKSGKGAIGLAVAKSDTTATATESQSQTGVDDMAKNKASKTTAKAKKPTKSAPKKVAAPKVPAGPLPECQCGCGNKVLNVKRSFLQGHDARFHGYIKKYQRGDMKLGEFPALVQSYIRREGIKVGGKSHQ